MSLRTPILTTLSSASAEVANPKPVRANSAAERHASVFFMMIPPMRYRDGSLAEPWTHDLNDPVGGPFLGLPLAVAAKFRNAPLCRFDPDGRVYTTRKCLILTHRH